MLGAVRYSNILGEDNHRIDRLSLQSLRYDSGGKSVVTYMHIPYIRPICTLSPYPPANFLAIRGWSEKSKNNNDMCAYIGVSAGLPEEGKGCEISLVSIS